MSNDEYKRRIIEAVKTNCAKQLKKVAGPQRRNQKPEKEVEKACLELMRSWGWSMQILEAKATFDPKIGRWRQQAMKQGTLDCIGSTNEGIGAYIEFKAPGALSTLRPAQRDFILEKINANAFSCVTDSPQRLELIYNRWLYYRRKNDLERAKGVLINALPPLRKTRLDNKPLFDEE